MKLFAITTITAGALTAAALGFAGAATATAPPVSGCTSNEIPAGAVRSAATAGAVRSACTPNSNQTSND